MADWFSPADIESPTLEEVIFKDLKTDKNVAFEKIHPRIFSEVMRDVDLVVSVAHAGAVDPEASHSTIEMRSVLLRETARLFKLNNISIEGSHVRIKGTMGEYSVHIGSAVVNKMTSGYLSSCRFIPSTAAGFFFPSLTTIPAPPSCFLKYYYSPAIKRFRILRSLASLTHSFGSFVLKFLFELNS